MSDELEYNALPEQSIDAHIVEVCKTLAWWQRRMEAKIQKNKHKGYWRQAEMGYLMRRLHQEVLELSEALGADGDVIDECVDVANFAMMLADVWRHTHGETP